MPPAFTFPIRAICTLLILLLTHAVVFADGGIYHVIHARLEMKDGSVKSGYFNLPGDEGLLSQDKTGAYYYSHRSRQLMRLHPLDSTSQGVRPAPTDYHFSHELLFRLRDTVRLFVDAAVISMSTPEQPQAWPVAAMLGSPSKIAIHKIEYVSIESIQVVSAIVNQVRSSIGGTRLTLEDRSWIKSHIVFRENAGGQDICSLEAISFQKPGSTAMALINELRAVSKDFEQLPDSEKDYDKLILDQAAIIEKLRHEHVIVIISCSC